MPVNTNRQKCAARRLTGCRLRFIQNAHKTLLSRAVWAKNHPATTKPNKTYNRRAPRRRSTTSQVPAPNTLAGVWESFSPSPMRPELTTTMFAFVCVLHLVHSRSSLCIRLRRQTAIGPMLTRLMCGDKGCSVPSAFFRK